MKDYGWPLKISKIGAGLNQTLSDIKKGVLDINKLISNYSNLGDDPRDSAAIEIGYSLRY